MVAIKVILILLAFHLSACKPVPTTYKQNLENTPTPSVTTKERIENVKRKGNQVIFDYIVIAPENDLGMESHVIADCKTQLYRTTYWAITKKGIPITENDKEPNKIRTPNEDMKRAIKSACK